MSELDALRAERDRAREECGHEKAMRKFSNEELHNWIINVTPKKVAEATEVLTAELAVLREAVSGLAYESATSGCIHLNDMYGRLRALLGDPA